MANKLINGNCPIFPACFPHIFIFTFRAWLCLLSKINMSMKYALTVFISLKRGPFASANPLHYFRLPFPWGGGKSAPL